MAPGRLYLIPTWLAQGDPAAVLPAPVLARVRQIDAFVAENARSARRFLAACGHPKPLREVAIEELNEHTPADRIGALLAPALAGRDLGLVSEAGAPAVADPGAALVALAHQSGVDVVPCVGPSSILLALMASGLDGQRFRFVGYIPATAAERRVAITELEQQSARNHETQVVIETPYRNDALLADLLAACRPATRLCVAASLTAPEAWIRSDTVAAWRARPVAIGKRPAIFLLLA